MLIYLIAVHNLISNQLISLFRFFLTLKTFFFKRKKKKKNVIKITFEIKFRDKLNLSKHPLQLH